jgi:hypothetical protein
MKEKPFDQNALQQILQFTQRYQNLAQAKYAYAFPNPSAANETDRWQHVGEALLGSIGTGTVSYPVKAFLSSSPTIAKGMQVHSIRCFMSTKLF